MSHSEGFLSRGEAPDLGPSLSHRFPLSPNASQMGCANSWRALMFSFDSGFVTRFAKADT